MPCYVGRYRQFRKQFPEDGARIVAAVTQSGGHSARAHIEFSDDRGELIARLDDYECVVDASLASAFRANRLNEGLGIPPR